MSSAGGSSDVTSDIFNLPDFMSSSDSFNLAAYAAELKETLRTPFSDDSSGSFDMAAYRAEMEEKLRQEQETQEISETRLFSIRRSQELCDGWIEVGYDTVPVHMAVVADISPIFKAAFSADSKEGRNKTIILNGISRKSVDVILDFAYGAIAEALKTDMGLCLEVWRDAHRYKIDDLCEQTSAIASFYATWKHRCQVLQHAMLYGDGDGYFSALARKNLAKDIVMVAKNCADVYDLDSKQMVMVFSSNDLVATEDEKLEIMMKWKELNPAVSTAEFDDIFCWLRLERLKCTKKVEELCMSADIPASLDYKRHKLCFNKLWENTGMRYMPLSEGDVRTIVRADEWSFFSYRNLAMAACALKEDGLLLKCEHQETEKEVSRFYSYGLQLQLTEEWFYFSVQHESPVYSGYLLFKIRFTDEPFCIRVKFPDNHLPVGKYGNFFWLTMSGTDGKNTKYQNFWEEENAEIHMTQVFVPAGDVVTNDSTSATANAAEGGG